MEVVLLLIGGLFGVSNADSIGYQLSKLMSWRKTEISGSWVSEYLKDGETVSENLHIHGSFLETSWGILEVKTLDGHLIQPYKLKLVREFSQVYSVVYKPLDRSLSDIGAGTMVLDESGNFAQGSIVGVDTNTGEPLVRIVSAHRAPRFETNKV